MVNRGSSVSLPGRADLGGVNFCTNGLPQKPQFSHQFQAFPPAVNQHVLGFLMPSLSEIHYVESTLQMRTHRALTDAGPRVVSWVFPIARNLGFGSV